MKIMLLQYILNLRVILCFIISQMVFSGLAAEVLKESNDGSLESRERLNESKLSSSGSIDQMNESNLSSSGSIEPMEESNLSSSGSMEQLNEFNHSSSESENPLEASVYTLYDLGETYIFECQGGFIAPHLSESVEFSEPLGNSYIWNPLKNAVEYISGIYNYGTNYKSHLQWDKYHSDYKFFKDAYEFTGVDLNQSMSGFYLTGGEIQDNGTNVPTDFDRSILK